jgi:hypothetical protein
VKKWEERRKSLMDVAVVVSRDPNDAVVDNFALCFLSEWFDPV